MRRLASRVAQIAFLTMCLFLLVIPSASAYIDPGSGSLIFQAVVGGVLAAGVAIGAFWQRILGFFSRRKK